MHDPNERDGLLQIINSIRLLNGSFSVGDDSSMICSKKESSLEWKSTGVKSNPTIEATVFGGPSREFLYNDGLNDKSMSAGWLNALISIPSNDNLY